MKLLLVDDHPVLRDGVELLVRQAFDAVESVATAGTLVQARQQLDADPGISLVLLDLGLPDASGLQALHGLRRTHDHVTTVVLSAERDADLVLAAIDAGAAGFVPKSSSSTEMLAALRHVLAGGVYLPSAVVAQRSMAAQAASSLFTPRQIDVLRLLLHGKSNKVICRDLGLSETTVKTHIVAIFDRLDVHSRTQAVVAAARLGWRLGV